MVSLRVIDHLGMRIEQVAPHDALLSRLYTSFAQSQNHVVLSSLLPRLQVAESTHRILKEIDPLGSPMPGDLSSGELSLAGRVHPTGANVTLSSSTDLASHVGIMATTRGGKTTLVKHMAHEAITKGTHYVWILAIGKNAKDYNSLRDLIAGILYLDAMDLRICPDEPIGPCDRWALKLSRLHSSFFQYFQGPEQLEVMILLHLLKKFRTEETGIPPTVFDKIKLLRQLKFPYKDPREDARNRLLARLVESARALGPVVRCRRGMPIAELARRNLIYNAHPLANYAELAVAYLILRLKAHREIHGMGPGDRPILIILDDAQRIFARAPERAINSPDKGIPLPSEWLLTCAGLGIHFAVAVQNTGLLSMVARNNTPLKFLGPMGSERDAREAALDMGLRREHLDVLSLLRQGLFLCKLPSHPSPFLLEIPKFPGD